MKKNKIDIVRQLRTIRLNSNTYCDSIPKGFDIIYDNEYTANLYAENTILLNFLFGIDYDDIEWFLNEFRVGSAGSHISYMENGKPIEVTLKCDEDYYEYLKGV